MKTITKTINPALAVLVLACLALSPETRAVSPAPDGGYPGGNTAEGQNALFSLTTGGFNTAVGYLSLRSNTTGPFNTALGAGALSSNITGDGNTADGVLALFSNLTGGANTATGINALFSNTVGSDNTGTGLGALGFNTAGDNNTATGYGALGNSTGSNNTALGAFAGADVTTASNVICIGFDVRGNNVNDSCYIGNIYGATSTNGIGVFVNSNGRLGTATSSQRFKRDVKPMDGASDALFALKPVRFRYKENIDPAGTPQLGLVAEDVEKVNPDLVVRDKEGKPYSVRYDQVNAMLLNEFLKEHKAFVEEQRKIKEQDQKMRMQDATISDLKKSVGILTAQLKEQAAQIQRVSAQVQLNRPTPRIVIERP
jgi:Chaperone of endosialidase